LGLEKDALMELFIFKYFKISGETLSESEADKLEKFVKELNLRGAQGRLANSSKYQLAVCASVCSLDVNHVQLER